MKANVTMSQVYYNNSLMSFFFRTQAEDTLEEVLDMVTDKELAFDIIEDNFDDLDELEEILYNEPIETVIELLGLEDLVNTDEEEDEDEYEEDEDDEDEDGDE